MNSFSAKSDAELAAMASHGDQEAFACLYDRYRAMIFAKAREHFIRQTKVGVGLIVHQQRIVARFMLLDQIVGESRPVD